MSALRWTLTLLSCCVALGLSRGAAACGGTFVPPPQPGSVAAPVKGHRMAFAVSDERTVLWDQIQYEGAPSDFSWVLPIEPGAYIETSRDAWFESLDAVTTTRISAPELKCSRPDEGSGCGCSAGGDDDSGELAGGPGSTNGVTVLHTGTVGPYETVTLASTDGDTLTSWLDEHGYSVPDDAAPIVAEYVAEGFDFIALRLKSDAGVEEMTPVRVVTPGPRGALPLRMVAAGAGDSVAITLFIIGEARYALPDLHESPLDLSALSWDFATGETNYSSLEQDAFSRNFGASYVTTFADQQAFSKAYSDADGRQLRYTSGANGVSGAGGKSGGSGVATLADLYFSQAAQNASRTGSCPSVNAALSRWSPVSDTSESGFEPALDFDCGEFDDIGAAMIGMHPAAVWLTRVEMNLPRYQLTADCSVEPNPSQQSVSNAVRATRYTNPPAECVQPLFETSSVAHSDREAAVWIFVLAFGVVSRLRRRGSGR